MEQRRGVADNTAGTDEGTLVARAQDGDSRAFEELITLYQGALFRLAYRMLNVREDAEDAVQEVLTASWRGLPTLHDADAFASWLYRMATNHCLDVLRRRSRHPETCIDVSGLDCGTGTGTITGDGAARAALDPPSAAVAAAEMRALRKLVWGLSAESRACWLLYEVHGRSYAEIAAALGISHGAVRGRLARARHDLAEGLEQWR